MYSVAQILRGKGHEVWSISPDATIFEALQLMAEKNVGALLVVQADRLVGIFSERDYARKVVLLGRSSKETPIREVMTERVTYVEPHQTTEDCMAIMTTRHFRHLPVLDGDKIVGVISIGDVVKAIIEKQEFTIEQLEHYITGER
jgi:CBS domain-containing protein